MRLIVDTNELISFFNEKSEARNLSFLPNLELFSPSFALDEIKKHKQDVLNKFSLSEVQFRLTERLLKLVINFIKESEYAKHLPEAKNISPDLEDADFFALALNFNCSIWSEDKRLKNQNKIKIFSTTELLKESSQ